MKFTNIKIIKRIRNWKTWVALFALIGLVLQSFGVSDFEGTLGRVQEVIYMVGVLLGVWSDHDVTTKGEDEA